MNYNIPYYSMMPMSRVAVMSPMRGASGGLFSRIFRGFNINSILTNTQKTLNLVNQTIPIVKQMNPLVKIAKTMFRVMNEFKKVDDAPKNNNKKSNSIKETPKNDNNHTEVSNNVNTYTNQTEGPVFFIN